ncbi:glycosyltransferase [Peribacillus saganii]|uniref:Glycosyltransferase n=2 Tax=Peribacillus saganii TaxID=2303992 RepID=A0A372LLJ8_9BACI|nr:glycosyltransferase [Peribacillus saganii]
MLFKILENTNREKFDVQVISMLHKGVYGDKIEKDLSIPVYTLNIKKQKNILSKIYQCMKMCSDTDIIQGWMYHANLLSFLIGKLLKKKIIWGLHHSNLSRDKNKLTTIFIAKQCGNLSKFVDRVISCGDIVKEVHLKIGYAKFNNIVIPNGFNTSQFSPANKSEKVKREFRIANNKKVILHVARWDPLKDYENLIKSIGMLKGMRNDFEVLLVGMDINYRNTELVNLIKQNDVEDIVHLLGRRDDIPILMASADFFVLSSAGEGFPNVIGEAMASGTFCLVTDTGDCASMVGKYGRVVPTQDSEAFANALNQLLSMDVYQYNVEVLGARDRVIKNYDILNVVKKYEELYNNLVD